MSARCSNADKTLSSFALSPVPRHVIKKLLALDNVDIVQAIELYSPLDRGELRGGGGRGAVGEKGGKRAYGREGRREGICDKGPSPVH